MADTSIHKRVEWVDAAKCIGIFMIYFYHFADWGGGAYYFVGEFQVPLFFFLGGCFVRAGQETRFFIYLKHKAKTLLVPYLAFCGAAVVMLTLVSNNSKGGSEIVTALYHIVLGQDYHPDRTSCVYVGARWFILCLFLLSIAYYPIKKYLHNKWLRLAVCAALHIVLCFVCGWDMRHYPQWLFGLDRVIYFMVYYCLGDVLFSLLCSVQQLCTTKKKILHMALLVLSSGIAFFVFNKGSVIAAIGQTVAGIPVVSQLCILAVTLCLLIWIALCSRYLCFGFMMSCGKNTLYLCGLEQIVRTMLVSLLSFLPLSLNINPFATLILAAALLGIANKFVVLPLRAGIEKAKASFCVKEAS